MSNWRCGKCKKTSYQIPGGNVLFGCEHEVFPEDITLFVYGITAGIFIPILTVLYLLAALVTRK